MNNKRKFLISWRYIAGFFDGEGHVFNSKKEIRVRVEISQKRKKVLLLIQKFLYNRKILASLYLGNKVYSLRISRIKDCLKFYEQILPYSVVKVEEIQKAIEVLKKQIKLKTNIHVTQEEVIQIKQLSQSGKSNREIAKIVNRDRETINRYVNFPERLYCKLSPF